MSRPQRIEFEGAYYHVMNRGRGRDDIFHGDVYFETFLQTLEEAVERFNVEVHSYCLMSNHYHLLIKTPEANLQRAMRHINGVYTQRYNRLKGCDGSLFRGRYKSILVDSDEYLLHVSKYIHLNPIEAKLVDSLDDYSWSSYRAYVGKCKAPSWLSRREVYSQLTGSRLRASRYRAYVEELGSVDEIVAFYSKQRLSPVLGSAGFINEVSKLRDGEVSIEESKQDRIGCKPNMDEIVNAVANFYKVDRAELIASKRGRGLKNFPRKVAMYLCQLKGQYRLVEIADYFELNHYGGVASSIAAVKKEVGSSRKIKKEINSIVNRFDL